MIFGKCFPKENSVVTYGTFIAVKPVKTGLTTERRKLTVVVNMNITTISTAE